MKHQFFCKIKYGQVKLMIKLEDKRFVSVKSFYHPEKKTKHNNNIDRQKKNYLFEKSTSHYQHLPKNKKHFSNTFFVFSLLFTIIVAFFSLRKPLNQFSCLLLVILTITNTITLIMLMKMIQQQKTRIGYTPNLSC